MCYISAWREKAYMALPKSRNKAPGLQSLIALSKHSRVVRMSFCDSSSIRPTGYVSLRSPWNPSSIDVPSIREQYSNINETSHHNTVLRLINIFPHKQSRNEGK